MTVGEHNLYLEKALKSLPCIEYELTIANCIGLLREGYSAGLISDEERKEVMNKLLKKYFI